MPSAGTVGLGPGVVQTGQGQAPLPSWCGACPLLGHLPYPASSGSCVYQAMAAPRPVNVLDGASFCGSAAGLDTVAIEYQNTSHWAKCKCGAAATIDGGG